MEEERVFNAADKGKMKKIYWGRGVNDTPEMEETERGRGGEESQVKTGSEINSRQVSGSAKCYL